MGVEAKRFDEPLEAKKKARGAAADTDLTARRPAGARRGVQGGSSAPTPGATSRPIPYEQLDLAIKAVFASWFGRRARDYRESQKIAHDLGTAVNVVTMVFGNMGDDSGYRRRVHPRPEHGRAASCTASTSPTPRARTSSPASGRHRRSPRWKPRCRRSTPSSSGSASSSRRHYRDVQDLEFTIERGKLYMLQTRVGEADRRGRGEDRDRHGQRGGHHQAGGGRPDRARPGRPAAPCPVRAEGAPGGHPDRQGPERVAGRGRRAAPSSPPTTRSTGSVAARRSSSSERRPRRTTSTGWRSPRAS